MSTHTPVEVEILASSDCVAEECEHEVECPTFLCVVCLECNAATQGTDDVSEWEGSVTACPIFTERMHSNRTIGTDEETR